MTPLLRTTRLLVLPLAALLLVFATAAGPARAEALPGSNPVAGIDPASATAGATFSVNGWAIDTVALSDAGINHVDVYLWPSDASGNVAAGTSPIFAGVATIGLPRPDIAGLYGAQYGSSGFTIQVTGQSAGSYLLGAFAHSSLLDNWGNSSQVLNVTGAPAPAASNALITMDTPVAGGPQGFSTVAGWAIDTASTASSGIDAVHVYIYNSDASGAVPAGAGPVFFSAAALGQPRPDIAGIYGAQFGGGGFTVAVPALADGYYAITAYAHSALSGGWTAVSRVVQVGPAISYVPGSVIPLSQATKGMPLPPR